jgi:predicted RNA-binding protein (virulence factor B family)
VPASKDLLKEGQTVSVAAYYDVKNRSWTTTHVYIIPETHGPADVILPQ